jgi:hypothetical protein
MLEKAKRFAVLPWRDRVMLVEALLLLSVASLAIGLLPFRNVVSLGSAASDAGAGPSAQLGLVRKCRWAVTAWANRVPWRAVCFQRGLALHWMLRRRGVPSLLHYGVGRSEDGELRAHVWVSVTGEIVLGGEVADQFACLATYPPAARA